MYLDIPNHKIHNWILVDFDEKEKLNILLKLLMILFHQIYYVELVLTWIEDKLLTFGFPSNYYIFFTYILIPYDILTLFLPFDYLRFL